MILVHPSGAVMLGFLIITSLSLAFYLGLLVFLYRDGRNRSPSGGSVYKVQPGSVTELGPLPAGVYGNLSPRRQNTATVLVRFAVNSGYGRKKPQVGPSEPAKVITLPALAGDNEDAQCG